VKGDLLCSPYRVSLALLIEQFPTLCGRWTVLFTALHDAECRRLGRDPHLSAATMNAQSVKFVEELAHVSGLDAYKRVKGRKRHVLVDTLGIRFPTR